MTTKTNMLGFEDPNRLREAYSPDLVLARQRGLELKGKHNLRPASEQKKGGDSRLLIVIDAEWDFTEKGRLPVPGAFDDIERLCKRLYKGIVEEKYTDLILTVDLHPPHTVHGDSWWEDEDGNPPDATLPVQMELVEPDADYPFLGHFADGSTKRFRARIMRKHTTETYAPYLKRTGQGNIWVFNSHCRDGTDGPMLVPALAELVELMSVARDIQPLYMYKGMIPQVDWFGPFRPTMDVPSHPQGGLQKKYLEMIRDSNYTDVAGEAADFCVKHGMLQVLDYYGQDPDVLKRINFLTDCTSPIFPDDPDAGVTANADFRKEMEDKGITMITHDTPFDA